VNELVEYRIQRWLAEQRARAATEQRPEPHRPIVTVSREAGAGGTEIGRHVAERLGFRLWDQELVQQIAEQSGSPDELMRGMDERDHNVVEDVLSSILMGDAFTGAGYASRLVGLIRGISLRGGAVVVGRGSQFVVDADAALRVRVVAPPEARVRSVMEERGLSERQARAEVERIDRERLAFIRHHFERDATDPCAYDLVVNSSAMSVERAADVVVFAYQSKFVAR
jgi:cytidylate kinase